MQHRILPAALLLPSLSLAAAPAAAEGWCHLSPWTPPLPGVELFGSQVELTSEWACVSSHRSGLVQVYRRDGGTFVPTQLLTGPEGAFDEGRFGVSLDLDGQRLAVGASGTDGAFEDEGRVHLFERSGDQWLPVATLSAPAPGAQAHFGTRVALDGDWLAVSSQEAVGDTFETRVFVHRRVDGTWQHQQTLAGPDWGFYGAELALRARAGGQSADLFLGLPGAPSPEDEPSAGAVRHFLLTGGGAFAGPLLQPDTLDQSDLFGCALDFDGEQLFVGAQNVDGSGFQDGAVFVYDVAQGLFLPAIQLTQVLQPGPIGTNSKFGDALAIGAERLVVGARFAYEGEVAIPGAVHTFLRDGQGQWVPEERMVTEGYHTADSLGGAVAVDGALVLAGAIGMGEAGPGLLSPGAAVLFSLTSATLPGGLAPSDVLATAEVFWSAGGPHDGPRLDVDVPPVVGETCSLVITDGFAFGTPWLVFGVQKTELPLLDELLLVDPLSVVEIWPLNAQGTGGQFFLVPDDPTLAGLELLVQAGIGDPFSVGTPSLDATNGLRLVVGY